MTTPDKKLALGVEEVQAIVRASAFPDLPECPEAGAVGLEPEFFVFKVTPDGAPAGRLPLHGEGGLLEIVDGLCEQSDRFRIGEGGPPRFYEVDNGGRLTFEPGGQIEHSTAVHSTAAEAIADVEEIAGLLAPAFEARGAVLSAGGLDIWNDLDAVPQQLDAPRYHAMHAYLSSRGPNGPIMMRHTASVQVNLDLGPPAVARERWLLANLADPIATASFAASPGDGLLSRRARAWQRMDATRCGFPRALVEGECSDPAQQYTLFVLDADVLLFRHADGDASPGTAGFTFRQWIAEGHPEHGWPTREDFEYHLTTVFPEIRQRGFLEIRSADALPRGVRPVAVVFWTGLLYDPASRCEAIRLLEGQLSRLPEDWEAAAEVGLLGQGIATFAGALWELALAGAERLPVGYHRPEDLRRARAFYDRYVRPCRSLSAEILELHERSPKASLEWARERA